MNTRKCRLYGCLLLVGISAVGLYNCRAADHSFLKSASGGLKCWECSIDIPNSPCGGESDGQYACQYDNIEQKCNPAQCAIYCNTGSPNWYCNEIPSGGSTWCATPATLCNYFLAWTCRETTPGSGVCDCLDGRLTSQPCTREGCILTPP